MLGYVAFYLSSFTLASLCFLLPAIRLLAREGINAEQLARDLKSFELKVKEIKLLLMYKDFRSHSSITFQKV